jgi:hypothetical protein
MTRTTSNRIFRARLEFLVDEQGIERQAQFYGRTPRTVRRWLAGEATPSRSVRESVRRRGLTAGAPQALQVRTRGRFTQEGTVASGGSINAVRAINTRLRRVRQAEITRAQRSGNARRLRMARAMPTRLTQGEASAIAIRRERLVTGQRGRVGPSGEIQVDGQIIGESRAPSDFEGSYWDEVDYGYDSWEAFRDDYTSATE